MGSARLTIMLPSPNPSEPSSPINPRQRAPGTRDHTQERRILLTGKKHGETLLDVTLSETCFERVARSGIAVSVWEDHMNEDGEVGVLSHKHERERGRTAPTERSNTQHASAISSLLSILCFCTASKRGVLFHDLQRAVFQEGFL